VSVSELSYWRTGPSPESRKSLARRMVIWYRITVAVVSARPTWASEDTRTSNLVARPAESALTREKDARADGKCSAGFICRLVVALPDKSWRLKVRIFYSRSR